MIRSPIHRFRRQGGVSIVAAIFFLVLFAAIAAAMVSLTTGSNVSSAQDIQGSRAYHAARAGVEWGLYQVLDPANATATSAIAALPDCPGPFPGGIPGFAVNVACASAEHEEGSKRLRIYTITATASAAGVERQITVTAEKCRDTASTVAPFDCL